MLDMVTGQKWTGIGNLVEAYLGPQAESTRIDPYEKRSLEIWNLPENYKGQQLTIRDTVEDALISADDLRMKWLVKYVLPVLVTDQLTLQWEQLEKNVHLLDLTPYQTISHAVSQRRYLRKAQLVRGGITGEFELGFLRTPMGRIIEMATMAQFVIATHETMIADGIRELVNSHRYQQQYIMETNTAPETIFRRLLDQDRTRFAMFQKTKFAGEKLHMLVKSEITAYGGIIDCGIIPEKVSIFDTIVRPEKTDYDKAGPMGPARVNNEPQGKYPGELPA